MVNLNLSARQLAAMRAQARQMLPDTATIKAKTLSDAGGGVHDATWAPVTGGTVPCRLDPVSTQDASGLFGGAANVAEIYRLTMPYNAPLEASHKVVVGNKTYRVIALSTQHSQAVTIRAFVATE